MNTALWVRRDVLSVVSMLQRTYRLINQSCHPVCWSFQFCMEYMLTHTNHFMLEHHNSSSSESRRKEDRGNSLVSEMVGLAQSEVYTHKGCSVALEGAAIDVECPIVHDGPSLVPVEFSTWCCRSVCSSIAQGG